MYLHDCGRPGVGRAPASDCNSIATCSATWPSHVRLCNRIEVDVASGLVHTVKGTAANEADITQTAALLHGEEEDVFGDAGYTGADKRPELEDRDVSWNIAIKRSIIKALPQAVRELAEPVERALSQVRAVVEHPFHIVKCIS